MSCGLELVVSDWKGGTDCDGCGRKIPPNEPHISGIDSCCGGCHRHLCRQCVHVAIAKVTANVVDDE